MEAKVQTPRIQIGERANQRQDEPRHLLPFHTTSRIAQNLNFWPTSIKTPLSALVRTLREPRRPRSLEGGGAS